MVVNSAIISTTEIVLWAAVGDFRKRMEDSLTKPS